MDSKIAFVLVFLCAACGSSEGKGPDGSKHTTWKASDGPHVISEDLTIPEGTTLTIEPGVTVEFASETSLVIEGELIARGTDAAPIVFTGQDVDGEKERWTSVVLEDSSVDASYVNLHDYASGTVVEHCVFEHAKKAIHLIGASPFIHQSTFRNNRTEPEISAFGGAGLFIESGSAPRIRDCVFTDNEASPFTYGGAIFVTESDPILQNNVFKGNKAIYGGAIATDLMASPIVGSSFEGNVASTEGGAVSLVSTVTAFMNNRVTKNTAKADGGGVHVCVDCFPHAAPFIIGNTITENISNATEPSGGAAGVGAAFLRVLAYNDIHGNLRDGVPSDASWFHQLKEGYPEWVASPTFENNWWGTTDFAAIEKTLFDGNDQSAYGKVRYQPVLDSAPDPLVPRVTITTRNIRYVDGETTIPIFLTVYNPGAARDVKLALEIAYGDSPPVPFDTDLGFFERSSESGVFVATLPDDSIYFKTFDAPTDPNQAGVSAGTWQATLIDAETGAPIGDACATRYELGGGQGG